MHRSWLLLLLLSVAPVAAHAQEPSPPDIVRMADGSMFRGTLIEFVPGVRCVIRLATGALRTLDASLVLYAGPHGEQGAAATTATQPTRGRRPYDPPPPEQPPDPDPAPASPVPRTRATSSPEHPVYFYSESPDVRVHLVRATASVGDYRVNDYRLLCTAPCEVSLRPGEYRFGLSQGAGSIREADASFRIAAALRLDVHYESRELTRLAGLLTMLLGPVLGAGFVGLGYITGDVVSSRIFGGSRTEPNLGLVMFGTVLGGVALLGGLPFALTFGDVAHVEPHRAALGR